MIRMIDAVVPVASGGGWCFGSLRQSSAARAATQGMIVETTPAREAAKTSDRTVLIRLDIVHLMSRQGPNLLLCEGRNKPQFRAARGLSSRRILNRSKLWWLQKPALSVRDRLVCSSTQSIDSSSRRAFSSSSERVSVGSLVHQGGIACGDGS